VLSSPVRRGTPALAFCAGLVTGGAIAAAALLVLGSLVRASLPGPARAVVVAAALCAVLLKEAGVARFRLPESRRLVPESVFRLGRHLGPLAFGIEMGTGARTYLPSALPYAAAVAVLLLASPATALAAGAGFGLGRALMTLSNLQYSRDNGWDEQWLRHRRALVATLALAFSAALVAVVVAASR
jgi:hypothetical protein